MVRRVLSTLCSATLLGALLVVPGAAPAQVPSSFPDVNVSYHGGPLLQNVEVVLLFAGNWDPAQEDYLARFYDDLFIDGQYMRNLRQAYNTDGNEIGNGHLLFSGNLDPLLNSTRATDADIRSNLASASSIGIPTPDANTLYVVVTSPDLVVVRPDHTESGRDFRGYHDYHRFESNGGFGGFAEFAYAVVTSNGSNGDLTSVTFTMSRELAEAVTDPVPGRGWYDDKLGEIGGIVEALYDAKRIGFDDYADFLQEPDGTRYEVAKVWNDDLRRPIAFAPVPVAVGTN